jgi:hypothetical protein
MLAGIGISLVVLSVYIMIIITTEKPGEVTGDLFQSHGNLIKLVPPYALTNLDVSDTKSVMIGRITGGGSSSVNGMRYDNGSKTITLNGCRIFADLNNDGKVVEINTNELWERYKKKFPELFGKEEK